MAYDLEADILASGFMYFESAVLYQGNYKIIFQLFLYHLNLFKPCALTHCISGFFDFFRLLTKSFQTRSLRQIHP